MITVNLKNKGELEKMNELLERITFNDEVLRGKPIIRGLRISVEMILELLAKGSTYQELLDDFPDLEPDDIKASILYAHRMLTQEELFEKTAV